MCIWPIESGFHQQKWEASLSSETLVECSGSDVDVVTEVLNFALIFVSYGPELSAAAFLTLPDDWWLLHGLTEDSSKMMMMLPIFLLEKHRIYTVTLAKRAQSGSETGAVAALVCWWCESDKASDHKHTGDDPKAPGKGWSVFFDPIWLSWKHSSMYTIKMSTSGEPNIAKSGYGAGMALLEGTRCLRSQFSSAARLWDHETCSRCRNIHMPLHGSQQLKSVVTPISAKSETRSIPT